MASHKGSRPSLKAWPNFAVTAGWSGLYALALVGTFDFAVATGIYIAGFTLWFLWSGRDEGAARPGLATVAVVVGFAAVTAVAISALFRYGFLVRLP